mmetsp:Transcript_89248/g.177442  ORF Transcript_89248/g.177442 Transcript_89248/m.177442 type:complete len:294 (+) Transcript_89248:70-951(+)
MEPQQDQQGQTLYSTLIELDDQTVTHVISETLRKRPELAPGVVNSAVPDLTYAPADALAKRRASGVVKSFSPQGFGFISCPELKAVFGHDVYVHKHQIGMFSPGSEVNFAVLLSKDMKPQAFDLQPISGGYWAGGAGVGGAAGGAAGSYWMDPGYYSGAMAGCGGYGKGGYGWGKGGDATAAASSHSLGDWSAGWGDYAPGAKRQKTLSADAKPDVQQVLGQFMGTIKSFNAKNGFGFIQCDALRQQGFQNDVYLHHNQIKEFQPGHTILFTAYLNKKGQPQAMDLELAQTPG